jgi:hypothetical protein
LSWDRYVSPSPSPVASVRLFAFLPSVIGGPGLNFHRRLNLTSGPTTRSYSITSSVCANRKGGTVRRIRTIGPRLSSATSMSERRGRRGAGHSDA